MRDDVTRARKFNLDEQKLMADIIVQLQRVARGHYDILFLDALVNHFRATKKILDLAEYRDCKK